MTFEQWWDTAAKTPAPDTFKNWEESCRQAWAAGVADERKRCEELVTDLPMKQAGMYWNDHCKSFAFYASACIKAPEKFTPDWAIK